MSREEIKQHRFIDLPAEKYPLRILMFSPGGETVFNEVVDGPGALPIPGMGPGTVRYSVFVFGDGEVSFRDDPSCSGSVDVTLSPEELHAKMAHLIELNRMSGRYFLEKSSEVLANVDFSGKKALGDSSLIKTFFELQARIGEQMIEAANKTEEWLEVESSRKDSE